MRRWCSVNFSSLSATTFCERSARGGQRALAAARATALARLPLKLTHAFLPPAASQPPGLTQADRPRNRSRNPRFSCFVPVSVCARSMIARDDARIRLRYYNRLPELGTAGHAQVVRDPPEHLVLEHPRDILLAEAVRGGGVVDHQLDLVLGYARGPEHFERQRRVLDAGDVHARDEQDQVRQLERRGDQLVERAGRVDDDVVVRLRQQLDDLLDVLRRHVAPLGRVQRRRQDRDAAVVLAPGSRGSCPGRCRRCLRATSAMLASTAISIMMATSPKRVSMSSSRRCAGDLGERRREVRRDRRLADAALRTEDRDHRAAGGGLSGSDLRSDALALFLLKHSVDRAAQVLGL